MDPKTGAGAGPDQRAAEQPEVRIPVQRGGETPAAEREPLPEHIVLGYN
jgi:hypothetical protein